jgi:hypothetical protein
MEALYTCIFGTAFVIFCLIVLAIPASVGEGLVSIKEEEDL